MCRAFEGVSSASSADGNSVGEGIDVGVQIGTRAPCAWKRRGRGVYCHDVFA